MIRICSRIWDFLGWSAKKISAEPKFGTYGKKPVKAGAIYGKQGVPVKMQTVPAGPVRHRSSVFSARAQLA